MLEHLTPPDPGKQRYRCVAMKRVEVVIYAESLAAAGVKAKRDAEEAGVRLVSVERAE